MIALSLQMHCSIKQTSTAIGLYQHENEVMQYEFAWQSDHGSFCCPGFTVLMHIA